MSEQDEFVKNMFPRFSQREKPMQPLSLEELVRSYELRGEAVPKRLQQALERKRQRLLMTDSLLRGNAIKPYSTHETERKTADGHNRENDADVLGKAYRGGDEGED